MVKPEEISDLDAVRLVRDIRKRIEEELDYPGHIKAIVIRETRATDYAKYGHTKEEPRQKPQLFFL